MEAHRNLELKARCADLSAARAAALALGAEPFADEEQCDTFLVVPHGRLKLREISGSNAVLIGYDRPDRADVRESRYHLVDISDPTALKAALAAALGVRGVVRKRRSILIWHNVRIHLDQVDGLGGFVEFEAVLGHGADEPTSRNRLARLTEALGIADDDRVAAAYADLLGL